MDDFPGVVNNYGIWVSDPTNLFIAADNGKIYHYDGLEWTEMESNTTLRLRNIWGLANNQIYAVGDN